MAKKSQPAMPAPDAGWLMAVQFMPLDDLHPDPENARTHSPAQIAAIEALLQDVGWAHPLGVADGVLVFGHARTQAAKNLRDRGVHIRGTPDPAQAPVVDLAHLSDTERQTLALADNRLAELAGWDTDRLIEQLAGLQDQDVDLLSVGFSAEDMADLLGSPKPSTVVEVPVTRVADRFWISVRGPLSCQAEALQQLRTLMAAIPGVIVELGTISDDGDGAA